MRLTFEGDLTGIKEGIDILEPEFGFEQSENGTRVKLEQGFDNIEIIFQNGEGLIRYNKTIHFFRALGLFLEAIENQEDEFHIVEEPQFNKNGSLLDCSRNAVMTPQSIKKMIRQFASMGLNMMMIYMEDTYTVKGEPYFGHMRGRYTYDELKDCDDYASLFGIELIPSIQTLGHLKMLLKWPEYSDVRNNEEVLLAGDDKTYKLIDKMIASATAPFRSDRIHIGMDEAWGMGTGRYLDINGYENPFDIFTAHLDRVLEITRQYNLKPMIFSDMYFRVASKTHKYTDPEAVIPQSVIDRMPDDVQFVYWDYYNRDEDFFRDFINKHKAFGSMPVFAGGILTWGTFCTNYSRTFEDLNAALTACKKEGVREVFATIWQDDGAENNHFSALLGLQLIAEHSYARHTETKKLKRRIKFCTGIEFDAFWNLSGLDVMPGTNRKGRWPANVSKYALWQDPMLGIFDKDIQSLNLSQHYGQLEAQFAAYAGRYQDAIFDFTVPWKLSSVLSLKGDIGIRMKTEYRSGNHTALQQIVEYDLPEIISRVNDLREAHRKQWFATYKPFGWEVLDLRYGGLMNRIDTAQKRLQDYLQGNIDTIAELEEDDLSLDSTPEGVGKGFWKKYQDIVTPNVF